MGSCVAGFIGPPQVMLGLVTDVAELRCTDLVLMMSFLLYFLVFVKLECLILVLCFINLSVNFRVVNSFVLSTRICGGIWGCLLPSIFAKVAMNKIQHPYVRLKMFWWHINSTGFVTIPPPKLWRFSCVKPHCNIHITSQCTSLSLTSGYNSLTCGPVITLLVHQLHVCVGLTQLWHLCVLSKHHKCQRNNQQLLSRSGHEVIS